MLYYKVLNTDGSVKGAISLKDFRFYHPERKQMFATDQLNEAQYVILNGEYCKTPWFKADSYYDGKVAEVGLTLIDKDEYETYMK